MLIEKPRCNFKNCKYCFDGNCWSADKYENCTLTDLHSEIAKLTVDLDNAKTEVEQLIGKLECLLCHATGGRLSKYTYDLRTMETVVTDCINETYNDGFAEGYKECAREIFEEIDVFLERFINDPFYSKGDLIYDLAELKKKYTEEQK